jgi:hypothetical protein
MPQRTPTQHNKLNEKIHIKWSLSSTIHWLENLVNLLLLTVNKVREGRAFNFD